MTLAPKSAGFEAPATSPGHGTRPPEGRDVSSRWSKRSTLNLIIGVTGAAWALVAVVLKLLF
jgi:hypothetical protein